MFTISTSIFNVEVKCVFNTFFLKLSRAGFTPFRLYLKPIKYILCIFHTRKVEQVFYNSKYLSNYFCKSSYIMVGMTHKKKTPLGGLSGCLRCSGCLLYLNLMASIFLWYGHREDTKV